MPTDRELTLVRSGASWRARHFRCSRRLPGSARRPTGAGFIAQASGTGVGYSCAGAFGWHWTKRPRLFRPNSSRFCYSDPVSDIDRQSGRLQPSGRADKRAEADNGAVVAGSRSGDHPSGLAVRGHHWWAPGGALFRSMLSMPGACIFSTGAKQCVPPRPTDEC